MAPSMSQTRAIRLLQKSENSAIRTEPRVVVRVRVPSRFLLTPNYYQLQSTMIAQWARVRHVTVRILIRLFQKGAFATASLPYFQFCQTMPSTLLTELLTFRLSPCRNLKFARRSHDVVCEGRGLGLGRHVADGRVSRANT